MAGLKATELRAMPEMELRQKLTELTRQITDLRLKAAQGAVEQPHRIRLFRRDIARLHTVLQGIRPAAASAADPKPSTARHPHQAAS